MSMSCNLWRPSPGHVWSLVDPGKKNGGFLKGRNQLEGLLEFWDPTIGNSTMIFGNLAIFQRAPWQVCGKAAFWYILLVFAVIQTVCLAKVAKVGMSPIILSIEKEGTYVSSWLLALWRVRALLVQDVGCLSVAWPRCCTNSLPGSPGSPESPAPRGAKGLNNPWRIRQDPWCWYVY